MRLRKLTQNDESYHAILTADDHNRHTNTMMRVETVTGDEPIGFMLPVAHDDVTRCRKSTELYVRRV
jgi:hypothetical protein